MRGSLHFLPSSAASGFGRQEAYMEQIPASRSGLREMPEARIFACLKVTETADSARLLTHKQNHPQGGWFCLCGHSPLFLQARQTCNTFCQLRADCYSLPLKGIMPLMASYSPDSSSFSWFLMYSAIRLAFFPAVSA